MLGRGEEDEALVPHTSFSTFTVSHTQAMGEQWRVCVVGSLALVRVVR